MRRIIGIIGTIFIIIILCFCIIRSIGTPFRIIFSAGTILCNAENKEFISKKANIYEDFYIAQYNDDKDGENKTAKVILKGNNIFPSVYGKEIIIEQKEGKDEGEICTYISDNDNSSYAILICTLPYIITIILAWIIFNKLLIPMINYDV